MNPIVRSLAWLQRTLAPAALLLCALSVVASPAAAMMMQLADLTLEELLAQELDNMEVTGIHHTHEKGEFMLGYHFMYMSMEGNLDGTRSVSNAEIYAQGFMVAPTRMSMQMHMIHGMYGVTDDLTLMMVIPFEILSMDHRRMDGVRFTTTSAGISDLEFTALYQVFEALHHRLTGGLTITAPTGSIDKTDTVPGMMANPPMNVRLPYPMQLGSGTWDFIPSLTYTGQVPHWQWGAFAEGTLRAGTNDNGYSLGNAYELMGWGARSLTDWSSLNVRLRFSQWFNIHGFDPMLNPAMVPTADPRRRAGQRLDFMAGVSLFTCKGRLEGLRLSVDGGLPVYQSLAGPQLETDWMVSAMLEWTH